MYFDVIVHFSTNTFYYMGLKITVGGKARMSDILMIYGAHSAKRTHTGNITWLRDKWLVNSVLNPDSNKHISVIFTVKL